jgi:hypothetical protein
MERPINIVYFGCINIQRNWKAIVEGQLDDMIQCGVLTRAHLYIIISCEEENLIPEIKTDISNKLDDKKYIEYTLEIKNKNRFEYDGIKKLYDLVSVDKEKLYLYFHTKGMFNLQDNDSTTRTKQEIILTQKTLEKWELILEIYKENIKGENDIVKMALFPSREGNLCWFNFFWASSKYLKTCEEPEITDNRYYYEVWIRSGNVDMGRTFNIIEENFNTYTPDEAVTLLNDLNP